MKNNPFYIRLANLMGHIGGPITKAHKVAKGRLNTGSSRRLTDDERATVVTMLESGVAVQSIASALKISRPSVYNIRNSAGLDMRRRVPAHA